MIKIYWEHGMSHGLNHNNRNPPYAAIDGW